MTNQADSEFITISTAAVILNCHRNTIRNAIRDGKLNAQRYGARMVRLDKQDVLALLTPYRGGEYGVWASNSVNHGSDSGAVL